LVVSCGFVINEDVAAPLAPEVELLPDPPVAPEAAAELLDPEVALELDELFELPPQAARNAAPAAAPPVNAIARLRLSRLAMTVTQ
jgi:hypothetical protein